MTLSENSKKDEQKQGQDHDPLIFFPLMAKNLLDCLENPYLDDLDYETSLANNP